MLKKIKIQLHNKIFKKAQWILIIIKYELCVGRNLILG